MRPSGQKGFTLIEIAIVMVIIGLLTGGGISMLKLLTERKSRNDNLEYLQQARDAIISFANINGRLPYADTSTPPDGTEDSNQTLGTLPFLTLSLPPTDSYKRFVKYEVNSALITNRQTTCNTLLVALTGRPSVVDTDGSSTSSVAAILISAGPSDFDSNGDPFDDITTGTYQGNNTNGTPYIKSPPVDNATDRFDDVVVFIGGYELYSKIDCAALRCRAYEIWNSGGTSNFKVNSGGCTPITTNTLISSIGPGEKVFGYDATCTTLTAEISFADAVSADITGTGSVVRNCAVNFDKTNR